MKISVHTKISDLVEVHNALSKIGLITSVEPNFTYENALNDAKNAEIIFTNPNNLGFLLFARFYQSMPIIKVLLRYCFNGTRPC